MDGVGTDRCDRPLSLIIISIVGQLSIYCQSLRGTILMTCQQPCVQFAPELHQLRTLLQRLELMQAMTRDNEI